MPKSSGDLVVKFEPLGRSAHVPQGTTVRDAAAQIGLAIDAPCGGKGTCGKCRVRITSDAPAPNAAEFMVFSTEELDKGYRLACQTPCANAMVVEVPDTSVIGADFQILMDSGRAPQPADDPPVAKHYIELPAPTLEDDAPDTARLQRAVGSFDADIALLRHLPGQLRRAEFKGTAVLASGRLIDFEPGNTENRNVAVAFDVGTTTVAASLVDVATGAVLATTSRMNPQTSYGDDVLSRILHTRENREGLRELQLDIMKACNQMVEELIAYDHVDRERIYAATFSGNTTMQHLLMGVDPGPLGEVPFVPALGSSIRVPASALGLSLHPLAEAFVFPVIGGFVGGDTVAGILVSDMDRSDGPIMLVDIGTNGEIVLLHDGKLEAASTAAGPAFEGARIKHGMRAAAGAIEQVRFDDDIEYSVIGGASCSGICGSALIDAVAILLRHDIVGPQGMMLSGDTLPEAVPEALRARVVDGEDGSEFVIAPAENTQTGRAVTVTHRDIRELQLATAAIRAGISILLRRAGLEPGDLDGFLVAGGFGNYLRRDNAQRMGLLPEAIEPERFKFVGNASLAGAQFVALSQAARDRAEAISQRTTHVDLSLDVNFQTEYVEAMMFPMEG
ncbi:MAG: DUF4445 domain-containing protein [bacterium]|nr:DUF4445 domain-containing protein [bacterium]